MTRSEQDHDMADHDSHPPDHSAQAPPAGSPARSTNPDVADSETILPDPNAPLTPLRGLAGVALPRPFGRYRLLRRLGEGGMGTVFLAHDSQLDRQVALKVPHITSADGPEVLARFYREARSAATLHHPNICPLHDVGEIDGIPYLTMAFIEGETLSHRIRPSLPLSQRWAADIVRRIALAMQEAHQNGIIHRDLKPANVVIDRRGEPIIMDFGVARRMSESTKITQSGGMVGTPEYMAPEQALGHEDQIGPGCDIYALGVILYRLLTGRVPFEGTIGELLTRLVTEAPMRVAVRRPDVAPSLDAICQRALAKKSEDRFPDMNGFAAALEAALLSGELHDDAPKMGPGSVASLMGARTLPPAQPASGLTPSQLSPTLLKETVIPRPPAPQRRRSPLGPVLVGVALLIGAGIAGIIFWPPSDVARLGPPPAHHGPAVTPPTGPTVAVGPGAQQHFGEALAARKRGDTDLALRELNTALKLDPTLAPARAERAGIYLERKQFDLAVADLNEALKSPDQRTPDAYRRRAAAYEELKKDAEAAADYGTVLKSAPDAATYLARARVRLRLMDHPGAIDDCDAALKLDGRLAAALVVRGRAAAQQNRPEQGLRDFADALKINPNLAEAYLYSGAVQLSLGQFESAIDNSSKAVELEPKNAVAQIGLRDTYRQYGQALLSGKDRDHDKPIAVFSERLRQLEGRKLPQLTSEIGWAHGQRGRARQLRNRPDDLVAALKDFNEALRCNPDDVFSLCNRGDAHAQSGSWAEAEADFERALLLDPKDFRALYLQAHLRLQQNDVEDFRKLSKAAWDAGRDTKDTSDANLLIWLCSFAPGVEVERKSVVDLAEKVLASKPDSAAYLNTLGSALYRAEKYRESAQRLNAAIRAHGKGQVFTEDWLFLAMAEQRLGQADAAREHLSKGVEQALKEKPSWTRRLELQQLRKEAEMTVNRGKP